METCLIRRDDLSTRELVIEFRIAHEDIVLIDPRSKEYKLFYQLEKEEIPLSLRLANAAMIVRHIEQQKA